MNQTIPLFLKSVPDYAVVLKSFEESPSEQDPFIQKNVPFFDLHIEHIAGGKPHSKSEVKFSTHSKYFYGSTNDGNRVGRFESLLKDQWINAEFVGVLDDYTLGKHSVSDLNGGQLGLPGTPLELIASQELPIHLGGEYGSIVRLGETPEGIRYRWTLNAPTVQKVSATQAAAVQGALAETHYYDFSSPEVQVLVTEISKGELASKMEIMQRIFKKVHENVSYSSDYGVRFSTLNLKASEVLWKGEGIYNDFSSLMVTLARAFGIPARSVFGFEVTPQGVMPHSWVEASLDEGVTWSVIESQKGGSENEFDAASRALIPVGVDTTHESDLNHLIETLQRDYKLFQFIRNARLIIRPFPGLSNLP